MLVKILLCSLSLTVALELIFGAVWGVRGRDLGLLVLVNILTNPAVVLWHYLMPGGFWLTTVLPEVLAIGAEALCLRFRGSRIRRPMLLAICMNLFSYGVGLCINRIFFT